MVTMADTRNITDEWLQLYEESLQAQGMLSTCSYVLSDATVVATSLNSTIDHSPTNSTITSPPSSGPVTPNNYKATCFSKPVRKRSRASKKSPTTHLNADTSNFRALVQKFTGCHKKSISFGSHKSPINLNFKLGRVQNHRSTSSQYNILPPFGENYQLMCVQEQPQIGWPTEQPRVDLQLHALTQVENNCMASNLLDDHQKVEYNDHPPIPNNLETFEDDDDNDDDDDDDGFLWDDFDLHEYPILEESFSGDIVDCCFV